MNNLTITVAGAHASGKSRVLYILKEFLKEKGFNVEMLSTTDFSNEEQFDNHMSKNIEDCITSLSDRTKITFKEVNLNREITSPVCE